MHAYFNQMKISVSFYIWRKLKSLIGRISSCRLRDHRWAGAVEACTQRLLPQFILNRGQTDLWPLPRLIHWLRCLCYKGVGGWMEGYKIWSDKIGKKISTNSYPHFFRILDKFAISLPYLGKGFISDEEFPLISLLKLFQLAITENLLQNKDRLVCIYSYQSLLFFRTKSPPGTVRFKTLF